MQTSTKPTPTMDEAVLENRKLAQRIFNALARGDFPALTALWAPDVVMRFAGKSLISGSFRGRDASFANVQRSFELTKGTLNIENVETLAGERHIAFYNRVRATRDGRTLDTHESVTVRIVDGKTAEWILIPHDAYAWDAFWS